MHQGYVGKPTKNMVHVADFFFFSIREHTKILNIKRNNYFSPMLEFLTNRTIHDGSICHQPFK